MSLPMLQPLDDDPGLFEEPAKSAVAVPIRTRAEKSPTAYRTISEVAEELDVPQHVLRFWETKFTQLRPLKRGGGRRYYRAEDVALIRQIHTLLYAQHYTIRGAQKVLKDKSPQVGDNPVGTVEALEVDAIDEAAETPADMRAVLTEMLAELKTLRALV